MILIKNLSKIYSSPTIVKEALSNINLTIPSKGMVFIVGKSGCGKTTLLNIIGGNDVCYDGKVIINDIDLSTLSVEQLSSFKSKYIGFVHQDFNLVEEYTVQENIGFSLDIQNVKYTSKEINDVLRKVNLEGYQNRKISELSGGEKQRVSIARALIKKPLVFLCDEPTGSLDTKNSNDIFMLLKEISLNSLVIVVSHDDKSADSFSDYIVELKDGLIKNTNLSFDCIDGESIQLTKNKLSIKGRNKIIQLLYKSKKKTLVLVSLLSIFLSVTISILSGIINSSKRELIKKTYSKNDIHYLYVEKKIADKTDRIITSKMNEDDIDYLSSNEKINVLYDSYFSGFNEIIINQDNIYYKNVISSITCFSESDLNDYHFSIFGILPKKLDEVCITSYHYEVFKKYGYKDTSITNEADLIGKKIVLYNDNKEETYYITGIINTNFNRSFLNDESTGFDSFASEKEYNLYLFNSFNSTLFVHSSFIEGNFKNKDNEILKLKENSQKDISISVFSTDLYVETLSSKTDYEEYDILYFSNQIKDNSILLPENLFIRTISKRLNDNVLLYAKENFEANRNALNNDYFIFCEEDYYNFILENDYYDPITNKDKKYFYSKTVSLLLDKGKTLETELSIDNYYFNMEISGIYFSDEKNDVYISKTSMKNISETLEYLIGSINGITIPFLNSKGELVDRFCLNSSTYSCNDVVTYKSLSKKNTEYFKLDFLKFLYIICYLFQVLIFSYYILMFFSKNEKNFAIFLLEGVSNKNITICFFIMINSIFIFITSFYIFLYYFFNEILNKIMNINNHLYIPYSLFSISIVSFVVLVYIIFISLSFIYLSVKIKKLNYLYVLKSKE